MRKTTAILCTTAMTLLLTACGGTKEAVSIDTSALASELQAAVTSDTLTETAAELLPNIYFYDADSVENAVAYASSGATACEIAVVESKEEKNTSEVEKRFQNRVDSQSDLYASYNEGEVAKLENAIIESNGVYTVLCVCDDTEKANEILKEYGF